jgi:hypothetical protein
MFKAVMEFKEVNGDCKVPYGYENNPQLGIWVRTQRQGCKNGKHRRENSKDGGSRLLLESA